MISINIPMSYLFPLIAPIDGIGAIGGLIENNATATFEKTLGKIVEMVPLAAMASAWFMTPPLFTAILLVPPLIAGCKEIADNQGYKNIALALNITDFCLINAVRVIGIVTTTFITIILFAEGCLFLGTTYSAILVARAYSCLPKDCLSLRNIF